MLTALPMPARPLAVLLALAALVPVAGALAAEPAATPLVAPTRLQNPPEIYLLLRLPGDRASLRYTPGALDRAANLQTRLELVARTLERWADRPIEVSGYVVNRDEWDQAGFTPAYGVPARVGRWGVAAPAFGDAGTVALWSRLLGGALPEVAGLPLRGTPQEASTLAVSDVLAQLLVAEALVDELAIAGGEHWVRGLVAHVVAEALVRRLEPQRAAELDRLWATLGAHAADTPRSARDYGPDLSLDEWLWYQARFREGAKLLVDAEGKNDVVPHLLKRRKKDGGVLDGDALLRRHDPLADWFHTTFTTVSLRRASNG